jgi:hypothetical protein
MSATMLREGLFGRSCLLVLSCFPLTSHAQVLDGSLTGTVTDKTDAGIPPAKVEATNAGTGVVK